MPSKKEHVDIKTEEEMKVTNELLDILATISKPDEIERLIDDLLTEKEKVDIINRYLIMQDLYLGKSQRDIASNRNMSLSGITRGSKMLKKPNGYIKKVLSDKYDDHTHI